MHNRGSLYVGLLLIATGLYFALAYLAEQILELGWDQFWPGLLLLIALAFYLPILLWWDQRSRPSGLAIPGTIFLVNALIFYYNTQTGDWGSWAYLWTLETVAVGFGLYVAWLFGPRSASLLAGARALTIIGLVLFAIMGVFLGTGVARIVASIMLIGLGVILLLRGLISSSPRPAARGKG